MADANEMALDELENKIRAKVESLTNFGDKTAQKKTLEKVFNYFDEDRSGKVSLDEFEAALVRMNFVGVQAEVTALFDRYDEQDDGRISYAEFSSGLFDNKMSADPNSKSIVERVKGRILERGGKNGIRTLTKILVRMDDTGDFCLNVDEFTEGLAVYGVRDVPEADVQKLMNYFDRDGSGKISIEEFLRGVRGKIKKRRAVLIKQAWGYLDTAGDGKVTMADMQTKYDCSQAEEVLAGTKTEEEIMDEFMDTWDKSGDNVITWPEFFDYYKDISAGIEHDDYFELMIRNAWHMSGGEGWAENTTCRRVLVTWADDPLSQEVVEIKNDLGLSATDIEGMKQRIEEQEGRAVGKISLAD